MLVLTCERCSASFNVDPKKLGIDGTNVRCGKCGFVFFAKPPQAELPAQKKEDEATPLVPTSDFLANMSVAAAGASQPAEPAAEASEPIPERPKAPKRTPFPKKEQTAQILPPLLGSPVSKNQRLIRLTLSTAIAVFAFCLGLAAIGVPPTPERLSLLFEYGIRKLPPGLVILQYRGEMLASVPKKRLFEVHGEIYNATGVSKSPPNLVLEVFSTTGGFLNRVIAPCCLASISPYSKVPFVIVVELNAADALGTYKVSLEDSSIGSKS